MSRTSLGSVILASVVALLGSITSVFATNDGGWLGMDHPYTNDTENVNAGYPYQSFASDLSTVGIKMIRAGFVYNNTFSEGVASYYYSQGISPHSGLNPVGLSDAAFYTLCYNTMLQYKGEVFYYIVGNEPDLVTTTDQNGKPLNTDPAGAYQYCQDAYNASRAVDPTGSIKIESPPTSNPTTTYLQSMINDGIANYCDYIGVHAYSTQIDDGSLNMPWVYQQEHGGTQKPLTCSEMGINYQWNPNYKNLTQAQLSQWQADFLDLAYVQFKRYGYSNIILFESTSLNTSSTVVFDLLRGGATPPATPSILPQTYDEIQNYLNETSATSSTNNFGFETPDPSGYEYKHGWVVYTPNSVNLSPNYYWEDPTDVNYQETTNPHSGTHCLQFNTSVAGERTVRRVVAVTPGQEITVSAWVYSNNGGQSHLKVEGYDATDGGVDSDASTSTEGVWTQLAVAVTPSNPWIVIELSSDSDVEPGSYVNFDDVAIVDGDQTGGEVLGTNFESATPGLYGSGEPNGTTINSSGPASTQFTVTATSTNTADVMTPTGGTGQALEFTIASASTPLNILGKVPGLVTGTNANNLLVTSFDFCPMNNAHAGPSLGLLINTSGTGTGAGTTFVETSVRGLVVSANVGTGGPAFTDVTLPNENDVYEWVVTLDLSSTTQATWGYTLTDLTTGLPVGSQSGLYSRTSGAVPGVVVFDAGGDASATPFVWLDNIACTEPNSAAPPEATTLFATNFDRAAAGLYGSGEPEGTIINSALSPYEQMTATANSTNVLQVMTPTGGTGQALQYTFGSTTSPPSAVATLPGLSTDSNGNNLLTTSFDFCPLQTASNGPSLTMLINTAGTGTGVGTTFVEIGIRGLTVGATVGAGGPAFTGVTLPAVNHVYQMVVTLDLSSGTQDTWGVAITDLTTGLAVTGGTQSGLYSRTPNSVPGVLVFETGGDVNASPYIWIDNVEASVSNTTQ